MPGIQLGVLMPQVNGLCEQPTPHHHGALVPTPHKWVYAQRIGHAQRLLEQGLPMEEVARRAGFGSGATLRWAFARERGTSPSTYARCFAGAC